MWRCPHCDSNLLDKTKVCPVCQMGTATRSELTVSFPDPGSEYESGSDEKEQSTWWLIIVGVLFPPLGILFLLIYWSKQMSEEEKPGDKMPESVAQEATGDESVVDELAGDESDDGAGS